MEQTTPVWTDALIRTVVKALHKGHDNVLEWFLVYIPCTDWEDLAKIYPPLVSGRHVKPFLYVLRGGA